MKPTMIHRKAGRFEGVLQLRNPTTKLVDWVYDLVEKEKKADITYTHPLPGGVDMYFSSQRYLRAVGKKLQQRFPGELKSTRKLFTLNIRTGKRVYRVTVLFRLSKLKKGQVLLVDEDKYKILNVGKTIQVQEVNSGKKERWKIAKVMKYLDS